VSARSRPALIASPPRVQYDAIKAERAAQKGYQSQQPQAKKPTAAQRIGLPNVPPTQLG